MKKILLRVGINSVIGVGLFFVWLQFVNFEEVIKVVKEFDLRLSLVIFGLFFVSVFLRSLRLKLFLSSVKLPLKDVLMLYFLAQFLSFLIPLRTGELTKSVYLSSQFNIPIGKTLVWIFLDRFLDFWVVLFMIAALLLITPTVIPDRIIQSVFIGLVGFSVATLIIIKSENFSKKMINFVSNYLILDIIKKYFVRFSTSVVEGFSILRRDPLTLVILLTLTVLASITDSLVWVIIFTSLGVELGFIQTLMGSLLSALTFIVPAAPGYVGSVEAAALGIFSGILGGAENQVSASAVIFHIITLIAWVILGLTSLYFLKFDLNLVWKKLKRED